MIDFPREPNPGENLDASWGARVVRALRALFPMPGPGINVSTGPSGSSFSVVPQNMNNEAAQGMQWRITAKKGEGGNVVVHVGAGLVAWGGGITYINNGADLGELAAGASARVVWATDANPVPLVRDPRWPAGDAPTCECCGCEGEGGGGNCHRDTGDPSGTGGDSGALLLVADDWSPGSNVTDYREIGRIDVSDAGVASIAQLQRDTIVALSIPGRDHSEDPTPDETPPCGHPLNLDDGEHPFGRGWRSWDGGGAHPLDLPGPGGFTPLCADDKTKSA